MNVIKLDAKEFAYIAYLLGADELYGLKDPFLGLRSDEIIQTTTIMQVELEQKGILELDFLGGQQVNQQAAELVSICAFCDTYTVGNYVYGDKTMDFVVYQKEDRQVVLTAENTVLQLCDYNSSLQHEQFTEFFGFEKMNMIAAKQDKIYPFSIDILKEADVFLKQKKYKNAEDVLLSVGLSDSIVKSVLALRESKAWLSTLVKTNFKTKSVQNLFLIFHEDLLIVLFNDPSEYYENVWSVKEVTAAEYWDMTAGLLAK